MPPGTPYNSFIASYPIRVDEFTTPRTGIRVVPALHLLTHTHSDHVIGLDAKSFNSVIVCSFDAKEMLLRHESFRARYLKAQEFQKERKRTYSHLKSGVKTTAGVQVNEPNSFDLLVSHCAK